MTKKRRQGHGKNKNRANYKHGKRSKNPLRKARTRKKASKGLTRVSLVWMFYASEQKRNTPTPFAEFRIWLISDKKIPSSKTLKGYMLGLLRKFPSVWFNWRNGTLNAVDSKENEPTFKMQIIGYEEEKIDADEAQENFKTTGYERGIIGYVYNYVAFFNPYGSIRKEYNARQIRRLK